jgi:hypothetical protein
LNISTTDGSFLVSGGNATPGLGRPGAPGECPGLGGCLPHPYPPRSAPPRVSGGGEARRESPWGASAPSGNTFARCLCGREDLKRGAAGDTLPRDFKLRRQNDNKIPADA